MIKTVKTVVFRWAKVLVILIGIIVLLRAFVFNISVVNQTTMKGSLYNGDVVLSSKLNYGGRTTSKPLTIPLSDLFVKGGIQSDAITIPRFRLPGIKPANYNDVVFIQPPKGIVDTVKIAARIVALPGDTMEIQNKNIKIGTDVLLIPEKIKQLYEVRILKDFKENTFLQLGIEKWNSINSNLYQAFLTKEEASILMQLGTVRYAKEIRTRHVDQAPHYLEESHKMWNDERFGPYWIPKEGATIELNKSNLELYRELIKSYEDATISTEDNTVYVDGVEQDSYTFKRDYIFVLSDNRDNGIDSRHFGPVPKDYLISKITVVLFSLRPNRDSFIKMIRPDRMLLEVK